jgi:hypothetical protein
LSNIQNEFDSYRYIEYDLFRYDFFYGPEFYDYDVWNSFNPYGRHEDVVISFNTGDNSYRLDSLNILFGGIGPGPDYGVNCILLGGGTQFNNNGGIFTPTGETILNSNTRYSVHLEMGPVYGRWYAGALMMPIAVTTDSSFTSQDGWYDSSVTTWGYIMGDNTREFTRIMYSVSATVVPEPSTYALFGLGALALVVAYRRKVA